MKPSPSRGLQTHGGKGKITGKLLGVLMGKKGPDSVMGRQRKLLEKMMSKQGLKDEQMSSGEHLEGRENVPGGKEETVCAKACGEYVRT